MSPSLFALILSTHFFSSKFISVCCILSLALPQSAVFWLPELVFQKILLSLAERLAFFLLSSTISLPLCFNCSFGGYPFLVNPLTLSASSSVVSLRCSCWCKAKRLFSLSIYSLSSYRLQHIGDLSSSAFLMQLFLSVCTLF